MEKFVILILGRKVIPYINYQIRNFVSDIPVTRKVKFAEESSFGNLPRIQRYLLPCRLLSELVLGHLDPSTDEDFEAMRACFSQSSVFSLFPHFKSFVVVCSCNVVAHNYLDISILLDFIDVKSSSSWPFPLRTSSFLILL